jgi:hypothetical protein
MLSVAARHQQTHGGCPKKKHALQRGDTNQISRESLPGPDPYGL